MKSAATYIAIGAVALLMGAGAIGCTVQGPAGPPGVSGATGATGAQGMQGDPAAAPSPTVTKSYNSTTTTSNDNYAPPSSTSTTTEKTSTQNSN
jgi:hypothetical protein